MRLRERAVLGQSLVLDRESDLLTQRASQRLQQARGAGVALAIAGGEADALTQRQQLIGRPADACAELPCPVGDAQVAAVGLANLVLCGSECGTAGARVDATGLAEQVAVRFALGTVEAREFVLQVGRQRRFGQQQQYVVEHDTGCARSAAGHCRTNADAATDEDRCTHWCRCAAGLHQLLQQDRTAVLPDPATAFMAAGDERVEAAVELARGLKGGDFCEPVRLNGAEMPAQLERVIGAAAADQGQGARGSGCEELFGQRELFDAETQTDRGFGCRDQAVEVLLGAFGIDAELEVEYARATVAADRCGDARVTPLCRHQADDFELLHVAALRALRLIPPEGALVEMCVSVFCLPGKAPAELSRERSDRGQSIHLRQSTRHDRQ